ncbi:methionine ABC transporter ATP-binding protein [Paracoccus sp. (in: a-proteobacteria)]|uniref:methionine ABC transporter ATP-binding protein n=1 Tax=Paracoccus sp. TaxID=267 RepID=UPI0026E1095E|nr:ATP-binding cassette domain-containing protein [Paracoccus sp. (in: a-proteobacteria)]MDO5647117.1 ATP-binding cassette domain-containing protein [Paracoccus sp. (in: a-proteobacteria)]
MMTHSPTPETGAAISFDRVGKTFPGGATALTDATLDVAAGSICGIIGRSGAGKSTLLRMVNGLEVPTTGRVTVGGHDVGAARGGALRAIRRDVGMIFQHFNLLASRTVFGNIALPLEIAGVPRADIAPRVTDLIGRVGLDGLADRYPAQLSGGQKQRVGIARALATRPRVLLSDEATSALDPETTQTVLALLRDINRDLGLTVLLITHEMAVVRDIASHVAVIDGGRIVEQGATFDVFVQPEHPTTRSFLSGVTGIRLPDFIAARMVPGRIGAAQEILRATFAGSNATDPMLARLTAQMGVAVNILAGAVEQVGPHPFGNLLIAVDAAQADAARRFLNDNGVMTEVLGYVR